MGMFCVGQASSEWIHVFGLRDRFPQDWARRFAADSIEETFDDFKLGAFAAKPAPLQFIDAASPLPSARYNFPKCVELLPQ